MLYHCQCRLKCIFSHQTRTAGLVHSPVYFSLSHFLSCCQISPLRQSVTEMNRKKRRNTRKNRYTLVLGVNSSYISSFDTVEGFYSNVPVSALPQTTECVWKHVWVCISLCTEACVKMWVSINLSVREQLLLQDSVIWVTHFSKARHFPVKVKSWVSGSAQPQSVCVCFCCFAFCILK